MNLTLRSKTFTLKNDDRVDKPNEDAFIADDDRGLYIVADGVSSSPLAGDPYPDPAGGRLAAKALCAAAYITLHQQRTRLGSCPALQAAAQAANHAIYDLNLAHARYDEANFIDKDVFCAVGTLAVVVEDRLSLLHVGDTLALLKRGDSLRCLTDIQTDAVSRYSRQITTQGLMSHEERVVAIRRDIRNNPAAVGLDGEAIGYGVFSGEAGVFDFVQTVGLTLQSNDILLLLSDGFEPLIRACRDATLARCFCRALASEANVFDWMLAENARFEGRSDDKTAIVVEVTENAPVEQAPAKLR